MPQLFDQQITLSIERLTEKGYGEGEWEGRTMRILGALPGEYVTARLFRKTKGVWYGRAETVHEASPYRQEAQEEHYQSCSPWQILAKEEELRVKQAHIQSYLVQQHIDISDVEVQSFDQEFRYRNKLEFSFYADEARELQLAFNKRGSKKGKYPVEGCILAPERMNEAARYVRDQIRSQGIAKHQLKSIQVRYSVTTETVIILLFVTDPECIVPSEDWLTTVPSYVTGIHIYYSDPRSPASTFTQQLLSQGDYALREDMMEYTFWYPAHGFFQVNPPAFESALTDIYTYVTEQHPHHVLDLYAGVGTLSLPLAGTGIPVTAVELFPETQYYADLNVEENSVSQFSFVEEKAEKGVKDTIPGKDMVLLDPPRSGLHPKILKRIREYQPKHVVYLSCNPKTQAMDMAQIMDLYEVVWNKAYDFYPGTPHVEHLVCLRRKFDNSDYNVET